MVLADLPISVPELVPNCCQVQDIANTTPEAKPTPALSNKARRELFKELGEGRTDMYYRTGGIRDTCEQKCDELDERCDIYQGLQDLEKKCPPKKRFGGF